MGNEEPEPHDIPLKDFLVFRPRISKPQNNYYLGIEPKHTPSQEEIRRECEKIQEGWSEEERRRRAGLVPNQIWDVMTVQRPKIKRRYARNE